MKEFRSFVLQRIWKANDEGRIFSVKFIKEDGSLRHMVCKWTKKYSVEPLPSLNPKKVVENPPIKVMDFDKVRAINELLKIVPETDLRCLPHDMKPERSFRPERLISVKVDGEEIEVTDEFATIEQEVVI